MRKETTVPRENQKVRVRLTERKLKSYDQSSCRQRYASLTPKELRQKYKGSIQICEDLRDERLAATL